ncbi:unnamed protein product [Lepeophtheirus salmonis]|uniref:(salmon louse) hypothetical protein n=1 Tax=Lepeophtheirus salmonis TaxID=72036 RepID=A0A7R8H4H9_LEPSM|nr:unnamed protein product [Lepeophtheirus salmonis]CAF2859829.1 unnamed protein product [Lepeophtheirus salmonis]
MTLLEQSFSFSAQASYFNVCPQSSGSQSSIELHKNEWQLLEQRFSFSAQASYFNVCPQSSGSQSSIELHKNEWQLLQQSFSFSAQASYFNVCSQSRGSQDFYSYIFYHGGKRDIQNSLQNLRCTPMFP